MADGVSAPGGSRPPQRPAQARELLPLLLNLEATDERQSQALPYLEGWDSSSAVDSIAATIYQAWFLHLGRTIFEDDLSGDLYDDFANRRHPLFLNTILGQSHNI